MNTIENNLSAEHGYREFFDGVIETTLKSAMKIAASDPKLAVAGAKILYHQKKAAKTRQRYENGGLTVPAVMMIALTSRCNLSCRGCYMHTLKRGPAPDMTKEQLSDLISQAKDLGVSVVVFAGGEPLMRLPEIAGYARKYPEMLFPVFTNGLLIDEKIADEIAECKNIVPMISFEGPGEETNRRRGPGTYERLEAACRRLSKRKVFFGCSIMVTSGNTGAVTADSFITGMIEKDIRTFVFVEYVPIEAGTEDLVLTEDQRSELREKLRIFCDRYPALFIGFPGEEDAYGGCLAAGRGFVHVSPSGKLEPCPAAPFSDADLTKIPLKDALGSELLEKIRREHNLLVETNGGCALWANREWVEGLTGKGEPD
jgi:MoaA/NifB/PqqE/SkfB family radical SAM enzyme